MGIDNTRIYLCVAVLLVVVSLGVAVLLPVAVPLGPHALPVYSTPFVSCRWRHCYEYFSYETFAYRTVCIDDNVVISTFPVCCNNSLVFADPFVATAAVLLVVAVSSSSPTSFSSSSFLSLSSSLSYEV